MNKRFLAKEALREYLCTVDEDDTRYFAETLIEEVIESVESLEECEKCHGDGFVERIGGEYNDVIGTKKCDCNL